MDNKRLVMYSCFIAVLMVFTVIVTMSNMRYLSKSDKKNIYNDEMSLGSCKSSSDWTVVYGYEYDYTNSNCSDYNKTGYCYERGGTTDTSKCGPDDGLDCYAWRRYDVWCTEETGTVSGGNNQVDEGKCVNTNGWDTVYGYEYDYTNSNCSDYNKTGYCYERAGTSDTKNCGPDDGLDCYAWRRYYIWCPAGTGTISGGNTQGVVIDDSGVTGDICADFASTISKNVLIPLKFIAPILLLIFTTIDFAKAVFTNNKDVMPKAWNNFFKRAIATLLIFFSYNIVVFIYGFIDGVEVCAGL